jgi:phosphoribosylformylglycinamidine synthase subunit PurS
MFKAQINVTLRKSILDPKGKASKEALHNLGYSKISDVRIGKFIELFVDTDSETEARALARESCEKLLANGVMEDFIITISKTD